MNLQQRHRILISGGGTGGHIFPAIAIANGIRERLPSAEFLFVGAKGRMEMEKVPEAGYEIIGLPIRGIQRKQIWKNITLPYYLLKSMMKASGIIKSFNPQLVVGVGGYASGPMLYMASMRGVPSVIQEQNSYAGLTNKWLSKRVDKIFVAYPGMERFFPKEKIKLSGNPVRKQIIEQKHEQAAAKKALGFDPQKKLVLSIGGSLGALTINRALHSRYEDLLKKDVQLLWQTGKYYFPKVEQLKEEGMHVTAFIKEMDKAYAAADIIVSRAGAISISELCIVGKPVILVPSPNVAEDHQTKNALALSEKNAAILVRDAEASEQLIENLLTLSEDEQKRKVLSENIRVFAKPDAIETIVEGCLELIDMQNAETVKQ